MAFGWIQQFARRRWWTMLKDTAAAWSEDNVPRHGAALAYYTVFSIVPFLVVVIAIIGLIFGREATEGYILDQIANLIGPQSAEALKEMLQRASQPSTGIVATVIATATLLLGLPVSLVSSKTRSTASGECGPKKDAAFGASSKTGSSPSPPYSVRPSCCWFHWL